jgi:hypothetical protein
MPVAFVLIVHNSGSYGEVQNLGLTPPNHGQTLGDKARAGASYRVADPPPGPTGRHLRAIGVSLDYRWSLRPQA